MKKENSLNVLHEKLKMLQNSEMDTLKDLKKLLLAELEAEVATRKQQIELIEKLIKNKTKIEKYMNLFANFFYSFKKGIIYSMNSVTMLILAPLSFVFWFSFGYYFLFKSERFKSYLKINPKRKLIFLGFWVILIVVIIFGVFKTYVDFSLKSKLKYLLILGLSSPLFLISCIDPYTEVRKNITETLLPKGSKSSVNTQGKEQDKTEQTISVPGSELNQTYSEIINDSLLGFNGIKKNPKIPQNLYSRDKNYVTEIGDASFIPSPIINMVYQITDFIINHYLFMLEDSNIKAGSSNFKDEYYRRLSYLEEKLKKYTWENL
ncbi:hypothetical protein [Mesomycoplasma ovipneumoniae]|uniref:hypothetical protein n=1 Tax=Mesomycoplasma ovipneumoniae TaxID=29562 RepID=UPI0028AA7B23|nr:hypothetical protein [Mesomycoplasma ovipneumoniae]WNM15358.1 hypothetical protein RNM01_01875 [Mesomycoplasma ovipneumoniae]